MALIIFYLYHSFMFLCKSWYCKILILLTDLSSAINEVAIFALWKWNLKEYCAKILSIHLLSVSIIFYPVNTFWESIIFNLNFSHTQFFWDIHMQLFQWSFTQQSNFSNLSARIKPRKMNNIWNCVAEIKKRLFDVVPKLSFSCYTCGINVWI